MSKRILVIVIGLVCAAVRAEPQQKNRSGSLVDSLNRKKYESILMLGWFNSAGDAKTYEASRVINPLTGKPFDRVFAFGSHGWVWELVRGITDNLSWSPLTDYSQLENLEADYVVAHSNGNDYTANAMKFGLLKVNKVFLALAPPAGFEDEAKHLSVPEVKIRIREGDDVPERLGKTLLGGPLMKLFQKAGDVDIGALTRNSDGGKDLYFGGRITTAFGAKSPKIETRTWTKDTMPFPLDDRAYFSQTEYDEVVRHYRQAKAILTPHLRKLRDNLGLDNMYVDLGQLSSREKQSLGDALADIERRQKGFHSFRTHMNGLIYEQITETLEKLEAARRGKAGLDTIATLRSELRTGFARSPEAGEVLAQVQKVPLNDLMQVPNWWTEDSAKGSGQLRAETTAMTSMAATARRAIVAGQGVGADLLYEQMSARISSQNVTRVPNFKSKPELQELAVRLKADVILGSEGQDSKSRTTANVPLPEKRGGVSARIRISDADFGIRSGKGDATK